MLGYFVLETFVRFLFHLFIYFEEKDGAVKSLVFIQILSSDWTFRKLINLPCIISLFVKMNNDTILSGIEWGRMVLLKYLG